MQEQDSRELEARIDELQPTLLNGASKKRRYSYELRVRDPNSGKRSIFMGEFYHIFIFREVIMCKVRMERYDIDSQTKRALTSIKGFPPKIEFAEKNVDQKKRVWRIYGQRCGWDTVIINADGSIGREYREELIRSANKRGVILSPTLMDSVFSPIEEKVLAAYSPNTGKK